MTCSSREVSRDLGVGVGVVGSGDWLVSESLTDRPITC